MQAGKLYFVKDEFYERFKGYGLLKNSDILDGKEHGRPCCYLFKYTQKENDIYWLIPISSKVAKYEDEYKRSIEKYGMCDNISFGYILGEKRAFLPQNLFPVTNRINYPKSKALSEYNVLFEEIMNSFIHFLIKHNGTGTIMLESRTPKQNKSTQDLYAIMLQSGTNIYLPTTISEKISTLNFNIKRDNSVGLQIADMIPLVFIRNIHGKTNPYTLYNIFSSKLYKGGQDSTDGYGLIKVLR